MKVFISGPMTGYKNFNRRKFNRVARKLSKRYTVLNPAVLPDGLIYEQYQEICLAMLKDCDAIYMLKGWEKSKGAVIEWRYAMRNDKMVLIEGVFEI